jgi:Cu/Ag efflux protein CusF
MPEMTMPFDVADRALLDGIEVGDRVEFTFTRERDGRHTIHRLRVVERARESHSP